MSARPIEAKQRRRAAKVFRRTPLPAFIDLVQWLIDQGHASTRREARQVILDKRVTANSHPLGVENVAVVKRNRLKGTVKIDHEDVVQPRVPASLRRDIVVAAA